MRHHQGIRHMLIALLLAVPALALATSDVVLSTRAKTALLTTQGVSGTRISVDAVDGEVILHGKVATVDERRRAVSAVRAVEGVAEVRNLLQVVPAATRDVIARTDRELQAALERRLAAQAPTRNVTVRSVHDGVALLGGRTSGPLATLLAARVARETPGVRFVAAEIDTGDTAPDASVGAVAESTRDPAPAVRKQARALASATIDQSAKDLWITMATKLRLAANSHVYAPNVFVDTTDNVVTLFGIASSERARQAAELDALAVAGVKAVRNEINVVPADERPAVVAADRDLEEAIARALDRHAALADVEVQVRDGVARLTGTVPSASSRVTAVIAARQVDGVRAVLPDALRVGRLG